MIIIIDKIILYNNEYHNITTTINLIYSERLNYYQVREYDTYHILTRELIDALNHLIKCIENNRYYIHLYDLNIKKLRDYPVTKDVLIKYIENKFSIKLKMHTNKEINEAIYNAQESIDDMNKILFELNNNDNSSDILHRWCKENLYTKEEYILFDIQ